MVSLYIANEEGEYTEASAIPISGYTLNTEQSYCGQSNNGEIIKDDTVTIVYDNGSISINNITKKGTKCYLYFDEKTKTAGEQILAGKDIQIRTNFSTPVTTTTTGVMYQTIDWKGTSYYFAGAPTDNWLYFGGFYWRIIRVNGDGSIRLIYNGTSNATTGSGTVINNGREEVFNSSYDRSEYVGFKYTKGNQHGQNTDSAILNTLQTWYSSSNLDDYAQYIDTNVGFCSDSEVASYSSWTSIYNSTEDDHDYLAYERLFTNIIPTLLCNSSDVIKEPVGLITADEVAFAGSGNSNNESFYLYNGINYWTMTPFLFESGSALIFILDGIGRLNNDIATWKYVVRPVINLSPNVQITGTGTVSDPYRVQ